MSDSAAFAPDLDAYFERIGYRGPREATFATLDGICLAHACAIPFENLDVLLGRGIQLSLPAIEAKLVGARRGGYCFEQNAYLGAVLTALGFSVTPRGARVMFGVARDQFTARTHLFLEIDLGGRLWYADAGIGSATLTSPIPADHSGTELPTRHERRRIVADGSRYFHQWQVQGEWQDLYVFTQEPMPPVDCEMGNWWTSAHPNSKFKQSLLAARATPDGRISLLNGEFKRRNLNGQAETRIVKDPEELLVLLREEFALDFPAGTRFGPPGSPWPA